MKSLPFLGLQFPCPRNGRQFKALAGRLRGELAARGLCLDERPFLPHVTLARRARLPRAELEGLVFPQPGEASRVTLFRSILGPEGARHKPLYTAELS
nr:2'-5' RNA ligase family protein [Olsenella timonensis]